MFGIPVSFNILRQSGSGGFMAYGDLWRSNCTDFINPVMGFIWILKHPRSKYKSVQILNMDQKVINISIFHP